MMKHFLWDLFPRFLNILYIVAVNPYFGCMECHRIFLIKTKELPLKQIRTYKSG